MVFLLFEELNPFFIDSKKGDRKQCFDLRSIMKIKIKTIKNIRKNCIITDMSQYKRIYDPPLESALRRKYKYIVIS